MRVAPHSIALVVPLKPGSQNAVRELLAQGPPFDPEQLPELEHHEVFMSDEQAVFVFQSSAGIDAFAAAARRADLLQAALAWASAWPARRHIAEGVYSWTRSDEAGPALVPADARPRRQRRRRHLLAAQAWRFFSKITSTLSCS